MFDGFEKTQDAQSRKRWFASTGTSIVLCVIVGGGLLFLSKQAVERANAEPELDVTFQSSPEPEAEKKEAAPPPPPPPQQKVRRPGRVAPAQPTVIPEARPEEADPNQGQAQEVDQEMFGDGADVAPVAPPPPPPPPPPAPEVVVKDPDPISENDPEVTPARAIDGNLLPAYPEAARKKGVEAEVILKIQISAAGEVVGVKVVRGEEPFASVAAAAVKAWRYHPALVDGHAVAVARLVKIPFRLHT